MKVNDISLYITIFMFIMTASDPIDIHIVDTKNILYKIFLAIYISVFVITCFLATLDNIPTLIILLNMIKIFIPSNTIGNNEFIGLYHRLNITAFIIILLIMIGKKYSIITTMIVPKHIIDNFSVNIVIIMILKTIFTLIPTIFKYSGYKIYLIILFDIIRIIILCAYIIVQFSKFKKKKKQEKVKIDEQVDSNSDSDQAFVYDASDSDSNIYEGFISDDKESLSSDSDIDFESFMSTLGDT